MRETTFRSHGNADVGLLGMSSKRRPIRGMGQQPRTRQRITQAIGPPIRKRVNPHQRVTPALLAGFNDGAVHSVEFGLSWVDDASLSSQRHKIGYSHLGKFLN